MREDYQLEATTMNVLIVKNIATEGPGTIEEYLRKSNVPFRIVDVKQGEHAPEVNAFSHLIIMGGPMAVYEMDQHPFLRTEAILIEHAIKAGKKVLGVCLGAQMLAHVLGARVYPGQQKEIGWYDVTLTDEGMKDPVISELSIDRKPVAEVFQWHGDTFDLPQHAVRLASSDLFPNQAFQYADRVYALQFHIEVTPSIVRGWFKHEKGIDLEKITSESEQRFTRYLARANKFYTKFFRE